jgi:aspartyl-tRNA(Asn)/glutamyl-tRNA(Gln) amidotransferase subunit A
VTDPTALTLREAAAAIAQGKLSAEALVDTCLDRAERLQPVLNCFISVTAERARKLAREADAAVKAGRALGPLHGVPLAHKDMFYRAGEHLRLKNPPRLCARPHRDRADAPGCG